MMANCLLVAGFVLSIVVSNAHSKGFVRKSECKADYLRPNSCFYYMTKGYCTNQRYSTFMERRCSSMCGYCCPDGSLSKKPFNQDCKDSGFCANMDRLPLLTNVTSKNTCFQYYNDPNINTSYPWVKYYCETTYGWCCMDKKTFADKSGGDGCPYKLCYNVNSDEYCQNLTQTISGYCHTGLNRHQCAWTCKNCRAKSPAICGVYGCCWNGVPSMRPDQMDCPICRDRWRHVCNQYKYGCLPTGQFRIREFALKNCPLTCKLCRRKTFG